MLGNLQECHLTYKDAILSSIWNWGDLVRVSGIGRGIGIPFNSNKVITDSLPAPDVKKRLRRTTLALYPVGIGERGSLPKGATCEKDAEKIYRKRNWHSDGGGQNKQV